LWSTKRPFETSTGSFLTKHINNIKNNVRSSKEKIDSEREGNSNRCRMCPFEAMGEALSKTIQAARISNST
jgi:hypothetical protein